jgi:DNA-binding response OmpR family regulator
MEDAWRSGLGDPTRWDHSMGENHFAAPALLVVEDDPDIRQMLTTFLGMAGFAVLACENAECALNALREQQFDLLLTDYALPRHSGLWLLENAEAEGLIQGTPVLIVTAHPTVEGTSAYEVIQKPFDLDDLIERVRYRLEGQGPRRPRAAVASPNGDKRDGGGRTPDCPDPVELILYVSTESPRSLAAVKNVKKILERFNASRVRLTVCDLSGNPTGGAADSVAFTPTLVRRTPGPRTFILGHITNPDILIELLADCEDS